MSTLRSASAALLFGVLTSGCADDPLDPDSLFGDLDPPTHDVLKGVYSLTVELPDNTAELRLRFHDEDLVAACRCAYKNLREPIMAGGRVPLETDDLEEAEGRFRIPTLNVSKSIDMRSCEGGLPGGTYDFKVEGDKLTVTAPGQSVDRVYKKIGD